MSMYTEINSCRVSKEKDLVTFLNLGNQKLTGVFPRPEENLESGPLELVWSPSSYLVQLKHTFEPTEMYGSNYGYRSGLNNSMVQHLVNKAKYLIELSKLKPGDVVVDIGSNDCTTLKAFPPDVKRIGIDPTIKKFSQYYPDDISYVADFFSEDSYRSIEKNKNAKLVMSIACFYDLEDPISFVRDIYSILDDDGLWHFEQAYLPSTLRSLSYDTACHEHIEYYSMLSVQNILEHAGMKIVDVTLNDINGGSFAVTACKDTNKSIKVNHAVINWLIDEEYKMGLHTVKPYFEFAQRTYEHRDSLIHLIHSLRAEGKTIYGYGASTKGNVLLQWCGFTSDDIAAIGEVNPDKFGCITPGTNIPIISEQEVKDMKPDYMMVLPWHFKNGIIQREKDYLNSGGKFIFPLPYIQII
jgi:hypothetical protein